MGDEDQESDIEKGRIRRRSIMMPNLPKLLSVEEKKYLLAVERGDMANVKRMLQLARKRQNLDINCVDSLGRGALTISIDQENLEMVELLIIMGVETRDALLYAISVEFVEAVELLLEHEELIHKEGEPYSWQKVDENTACFTPDITPLILAAHRDNYEILKILLDRGATLPMPHDIKCGCDECIKLSKQDSLRQALSRLNEYRALASPSLMALSSSDPILTAFQLSWELRSLAFSEPECKSEYLDLRRQCQQFAVDLLHQSRSSQELAVILNHDPEDPRPYEEGEHMHLSRLELAIKYKQKKFVAHPNIQQLLAAIWYEGVPGFRRKTAIAKLAIILKVALLFPLYCMLYIVAPNTPTGKLMRKPFMKFLVHASSYLFFLLILILVSQRAEVLFIEYFGAETWKETILEKYERQRGNSPTLLEYVVLVYVIGFIFEETQEMYTEGMTKYLRNMWNFIDFTRNSLYTAVIVLRIAAYIEQNSQISINPNTAFLRREDWTPFDFQLVAEGLFAAANIFSALKLVHLFSINPHLGPLQISLGRMVIDIVKFFFIYSLVLFAFACGLNQLLWYFSDLERQKCFHLPDGSPDFDNFADACMKWRRFANVFESSQSLFWASFGLVDLSSFELTGIKTYTRFWGLLMFGSYSVINVIVLLNLLIAMMSNSYAIIDEHSDTEWKFARTKLWMSYFDESATLPPPFNIIPTPKMFLKLFGLREKDKLRKLSSRLRKREEKERDYKYSAVMRALVWRYVTATHRKEEENPVTEDDVNELKGDISSFRYEIMEVLHRNGLNVPSAERKEKAILGKKNKVWERRLLKDFKVGPIASEDDEELLYAPPPVNETPTSRFRRIAKLAVLNSSMNKWRQVIKEACIASQIGHCHNRDSFKKQQYLQKAMTAAKKLAATSPNMSTSVTPIKLPDTTSSNILDIIKEIDPNASITPILKKREDDLISLESQKNLPFSGRNSSFKYILGNEFSSNTRIPEENYVEIGDIRECSNDTEFVEAEVKEDFQSPQLKVTGVYGENVQLKSPIMQRKFEPKHNGVGVSPSPKLKQQKPSPPSRSPTHGSKISPKKDSNTGILQQKKSPTHQANLASPKRNLQHSNDAIVNRTPLCSPKKSPCPSPTLRSPKRTPAPKLDKSKDSLDLNDDMKKSPSHFPTHHAKFKSSAPPTAPPVPVKFEENNEILCSKSLLKNGEKLGKLSVSFAIEENNAENRNEIKPIKPEKLTPPKSPVKTAVKIDDQKPSTSGFLLPKSPSPSKMLTKSPLASRDIQRAPKKYQPKYGWL